MALVHDAWVGRSSPMAAEAAVPDPELVDVVWRRFGLHVFLTYAEGGRENLNGDLAFATAMAEDAGLLVVESSPWMAHWVDNPEIWHLAAEGPHA